MPTPLESFMESLHKRRKCEESFQSRNFTHTTERFPAPDEKMKCELTLPDQPVLDHVSSLPAHTHTIEGFANTGAEMKCETKCEGSLTLPDAPLQSGWLVVYRNQYGALYGGCDDRQHGTVDACRWEGNAWTLCLTDGQEMSLSQVRSVGQTDKAGQLVAAWTVKEHGYDGQGTEERRSKPEGK
jgi:hypothetical protein